MTIRNLFLTGILASLIAVGGSGCASFKANPANTQILAQSATTVGTMVALQKDPSLRAKFQLAYDSLNKVVTAGTVTGPVLMDILTSLPVKELRGSVATIAVQNGAILFDLLAQNQIDITSNAYVLAAATGIRDGLKAALGQ